MNHDYECSFVVAVEKASEPFSVHPPVLPLNHSCGANPSGPTPGLSSGGSPMTGQAPEAGAQ